MATARLVIGEDVIGQRRSDSDVDGCRLLQHPLDRGRFRFSRGPGTAAVLRCRIHVTGSSADDYQTNKTALLDLLSTVGLGVGVKLEYEEDKTRYEMPPTAWATLRVVADIEEAETYGHVDCTFTTDDIGSTTGDEDGHVTPFTWTYLHDPGGLWTVDGEGEFEDSTAALTFIAALDEGTGIPADVVTGLQLHDFSLNQSISTDAPGDGPSLVSCRLVQNVESLQDIAALLGGVPDYGWTKIPADMRTDGEPDLQDQYEISGTLQVRIEGTEASGFERRMDPNRGDLLIDRAVDAIVDDFKLRVSPELTEVRRQFRQGARSGEIAFTVIMMGQEINLPLIAHDETVEIEFDSGIETDSDCLGNSKSVDSPTGMAISIRHTLNIASFEPIFYRPPVGINAAQYRLGGGRLPKSKPRRSSSGAVFYTMNAVVDYHRTDFKASEVIKPFDVSVTELDPAEVAG